MGGGQRTARQFDDVPLNVVFGEPVSQNRGPRLDSPCRLFCWLGLPASFCRKSGKTQCFWTSSLRKRWKNRVFLREIHTYIHACIHTYIHFILTLHTNIHTYIHACMHTYTHTCITYIPTYMHTYIHTYITYIHTLHYITLHYITLHYITLHYITLHYIHTFIHAYVHTLHYITLHYITLHDMT